MLGLDGCGERVGSRADLAASAGADPGEEAEADARRVFRPGPLGPDVPGLSRSGESWRSLKTARWSPESWSAAPALFVPGPRKRGRGLRLPQVRRPARLQTEEVNGGPFGKRTSRV